MSLNYFVNEWNKNHEEKLKASWEEVLENFDFVKEHQERIDWEYISWHQNLSEDFIREFQDKVDWFNISWHQKLSEDFIREFQDEVDWRLLGEYQELSEDFMREFQNKVNWVLISENTKLNLSFKFAKEFKDKLTKERYDEIMRKNLKKNLIKTFN